MFLVKLGGKNNLVIVEIPNPKPMQNHYIHLIENKPVDRLHLQFLTD
jgi:hypothetical protein